MCLTKSLMRVNGTSAELRRPDRIAYFGATTGVTSISSSM
jgi:hypothetical protein